MNHHRRPATMLVIASRSYYSFYSAIIVVFLVVVCFSSRNISCGTSHISADNSIGKHTENLIKKGLQQLTAGHDKASLRGTTSSQVIEYNPRNIAIMTLLNSVLILGGLLGTMSRNDAGRPFSKRVDFSRLKRGFLPKRFTGSKLTMPINSLPIPSSSQHLNQFMMLPNEHNNFLPNTVPTKPYGFDSPLNQFQMNPNIANVVQPRIPPYEVPIERRRSMDVTTTSEPNSQTMNASKCRHFLQCFDLHGKQVYNPSLSPLANSAFKLLDGTIGTKEHSALIQNVKELVQIEQKNACVINYVCQPSVAAIQLNQSNRLHY